METGNSLKQDRAFYIDDVVSFIFPNLSVLVIMCSGVVISASASPVSSIPPAATVPSAAARWRARRPAITPKPTLSNASPFKVGCPSPSFYIRITPRLVKIQEKKVFPTSPIIITHQYPPNFPLNRTGCVYPVQPFNFHTIFPANFSHYQMWLIDWLIEGEILLETIFRRAYSSHLRLNDFYKCITQMIRGFFSMLSLQLTYPLTEFIQTCGLTRTLGRKHNHILDKLNDYERRHVKKIKKTRHLVATLIHHRQTFSPHS